jgi:hypothetical protein
MIRVTFELLPGGDARRARTIGLMEISNLRTHPNGTADYGVVLTKCPPFKGALKEAWRKGRLKSDEDGVINQVIAGEDSACMIAHVTGHHRSRRGVYDLAFRALRACGLAERNPQQKDRADG